MVSIRRFLVAGVATLLLASACTTISSPPTIPPINLPSGITIPTIPPINLPSGITIPTIPPINLPSGITIPTIPPINLPSIPPINLPSGIVIPPIEIPSGQVPCSLVTSAEVQQILGESVTDTSESATNCTFITPTIATVSIEATTDTDLTGVQFLMGNSAQQVNIGGFPGLAGTALGFPAVYVQKPTGQLQLLGFLGGDATDMVNKLQQLAGIAITRMP